MTTPTQIKTIVRLNTAVYDNLVRQLPKVVVTSATTAHEAGFLLGVQAVLQKLREGYVVEAQDVPLS